MTLLHIIGQTSTNHTFDIGFAFMSGEKQPQYRWCLDALAQAMQQHGIRAPGIVVTDREKALMNELDVHPFWCGSKNLVCQWHINKNIAINCKTGFPEKQWEDVMVEVQALWNAQTEQAFNCLWQRFQEKCSTGEIGIDTGSSLSPSKHSVCNILPILLISVAARTIEAGNKLSKYLRRIGSPLTAIASLASTSINCSTLVIRRPPVASPRTARP